MRRAVGPRAIVVAFIADVTDRARLEELAATVAGIGTLRAVAHAAGVSPTMADWRRIFAVDLVGSALLLDTLTPLVAPGTAAVCFASMAAQIVVPNGDPAVDADCVYYIVSGSAVMGTQTLRTGDGFFIPAGAPYGYNAGPDGVELLEIRRCVAQFDTQMLESNAGKWAAMADTIASHREAWEADSISPTLAANRAGA